MAIVRGMNCSEIAHHLFMCEKSVHRYLTQFELTGNVAPKEYIRGPDRMLSEFERFTILQTLVHRPTSYLHEVQRDLFDATGIWASYSTICRTIRQQGFTYKKVRIIALQRSEEKRIEYMAEISQYDPEMLMWLDETGSDRRKSIRTHGYSLRGMSPQSIQLRVGGKRVSAIPVMTTRGIEDVYTTQENVDGDKFLDFLFQCVLPIILPFDGQNPRCVLVMDNASIHHLDRVQEIITGIGARLCFLPPYSPDLMPLEEVFSKVKHVLRANDSGYLATSEPETIVKMAF